MNDLKILLGTSDGGKFWPVDEPALIEMCLEDGVLKNTNKIEWISDRRCSVSHWAYQGDKGAWYTLSIGKSVNLYSKDTITIGVGELKLYLVGFNTKKVTIVKRA